MISSINPDNKIASSYIPDYILNAQRLMGDFSAALPTAENAGEYWIFTGIDDTIIGSFTWHKGDYAIWDGTAFFQLDNTGTVRSVNGKTGAVTIYSSDIPVSDSDSRTVKEICDELSEIIITIEQMPVSEGDEPSFTNKISTSIDTDSNVYQTVGYITGYRLNSTGALTPTPNAVTSGFIPLVKGDIIRVRTKSPVSGEHYLSFYDSSFTYVSYSIRLDQYLSNPSYPYTAVITGYEIIDSTYEFTIDTSLISGASTMAYIRANGRGYTAVDLDKIFVVTINQPIVWKCDISGSC